MSPRLFICLIISFFTVNWLIIFSLMSPLAVILLTLKRMLSFSLSFRLWMSPVALMLSFLSLVVTSMSRNAIVESVPLMRTLRFSGMVNLASGGAKGRAMSLRMALPWMVLVE